MIDLRSDTVTRPTAAMRAAMAEAEVGDDVFGDDPTVNRLESEVAELLGTEAALFVTSGTQSNLCALLSHCERGDEYIAGAMAHTYRWEGGGGAVLGGIQPQTVPMLPDGLPDPAAVAAAVKPLDDHFARTRLLCLENTHDGRVQTVPRMLEAVDVARAAGLSVHLDGARLWNAAVALDVPAAELCAPFDTMSMCLSKGLGAPAGSLLCGPQELIRDARRWRKMLGGGLRQAGILAAAGIHALDHHVDRLADDHARARRLADGLGALDAITISAQDTNMVFLEIDHRRQDPSEKARDNRHDRFPDDPDADLTRRLRAHGVHCRFSATRYESSGGGGRRAWTASRLVTHLDIDDDDVDTVIAAFAAEVG